MSKEWPYSKMTKWAHENGGPEAALEMVKKHYYEKGLKEGAKSKNPVIVAASAATLLLGAGGMWAINKYTQKKALSKKQDEEEAAEIKKVEEALVAEMKAEEKAAVETEGEIQAGTDSQKDEES